MLKNFIFLIVLVSTLLVAGRQTVNAQDGKRLDSSPRVFRTFFAKFKSAVAKNDKNAVALMTRFPFKYGFDAGDEGTMSKAQFVKRFADVFGDAPKDFLTEKNPLFFRGDNGSYIVSTEDAADLTFVKKGDTFKFAAYIVEP